MRPSRDDLKAAQACVERLQELVDKISQLETTATNDVARLQCVTDRLVKLKGLLDVAQTTAVRLPQLISDEDEQVLEIDRAERIIALARAEKIAMEAEACTSEPPSKPKKRRVVSDILAVPPARQKSAVAMLKRSPPRNEVTCLLQRDLARMLAQAMELQFDVGKSPDGYAVGLTKLAIEPLGGWHPEKCATLDDLCVAIARALNLKIDSPADPASYLQALRDEGLGVDTLLPARIDAGDPPVLLEGEVRAFFAAGYAVPLTSSRPLNPD